MFRQAGRSLCVPPARPLVTGLARGLVTVRALVLRTGRVCVEGVRCQGHRHVGPHPIKSDAHAKQSCCPCPMTDRRLMPIPLGPADAGEVLTLQRAAYVTEAQAHDDPQLPPLTQGLADLYDELGRASVQAWGIRDVDGRLVAAVRVTVIDGSACVNRLVVAPDRQGNGLGSALLAHAEEQLGDDVTTVELFTGEFSTANLRLYRRVGYQETHRTNAGAYELIHMSKARAVPTDAERGH